MGTETPEVQVGKEIVKARKEKHLTQKQLSEIVGIAQCDISRIENGVAAPSLRTLKRIADGLNSELLIQFINKQEM